MRLRSLARGWCWGTVAGLLTCGSWAQAASPTAEQALGLVPVQGSEVDYDRPTADEAPKCTIKAEKLGNQSGWLVLSPSGQVLRRFSDTNGDNVVDLWCYYRGGSEVYRDIDSDFNSKADQFRWLNSGGSRWALDKDEDGKIDSWKQISAEEVSAEVAIALARGDRSRFERLLLSTDELAGLGLGEAKRKELSETVAGAASEFQALAAKQRQLGAKTVWMDFGATQPGVIPAGSDGSTADLVVYENVLAVVDTDGQHGEVQLGTLVRVGDVWRVVEAPALLEDGQKEFAERGRFFARPAGQLETSTGEGEAKAQGEKMQALFTQLEALEKKAEQAGSPEEFVKLTNERIGLLEEVLAGAQEPAEREQWIRQLADALSVAVQSGNYAEGVERLKKLYEGLATDQVAGELVAYVEFRFLTADYNHSLLVPNADFPKIQETWLGNLKKFVTEHPTCPDAAEALLQLGMGEELVGNEDEAKKWYDQLVTAFGDTPAAKKAAGARARLDSVGKTLELKGKNPKGGLVDLASKDYRGKLVLIHFWATWCEPCKTEMAILKELHAKYGAKGFALLGVSLDNQPEEAVNYLKENRIPWPQIYEPGGLDSPPATKLGILTLPTMILLDSSGKVVNRNIHVAELPKELQDRLK